VAFVDDILVLGLGPRIEMHCGLIAGNTIAARGRIPWARQSAARQGAPWHYSNSLSPAQRQHLSFFLAVYQIIVWLHGHEARPSVLIGDVQRLTKLPRHHGRGTDIACLSHFDYVMQGFQRLFEWCVVVPTMNLLQIDEFGV
jgi:hypothetical protein